MAKRRAKRHSTDAGGTGGDAGRELELDAGAKTGELDGATASASATEQTVAAEPGVDAGETPPGSVGLVTVEVDRPAILEEAAQVADAAEPPASSSSSAELEQPTPAPAGELDVNARAADVAPAVQLLVSECCATFAPGWRVSSEESERVANAAALVLAHWMPAGVIEPKYVALFTLATSLYGVAAKRRRPDGSWFPLREPVSSSSSTSPTPAAIAL